MSLEDVKKKVEEEVEKVEELKDEVIEEVTGGYDDHLESKKLKNPAEVIDKSNNKHSDVL